MALICRIPRPHSSCLDPLIKPQIVIVPIKYDWHSVVNGRGHSVGSCRQNRTHLQEFAGRIFPSSPDPRKCEQLTCIDLKAVRLFFLSKPLALIKPICGNQASAKFQRIAVCRLRRRLFLGILTADRDGLSGSYVIAGTPVLLSCAVELLFNELFSSRQSVAPIHSSDYGRLGQPFRRPDTPIPRTHLGSGKISPTPLSGAR